jgi:ABC-type lipoprotein export system ATPase subunit
MKSPSLEFLNRMPGAFPDTEEDFLDTESFNTMFSRKKEVVIAVMGVTGAGKSTFIQTVSGRKDVIVGDTLTSGMFNCRNSNNGAKISRQRRKKYFRTNSNTRV